MTLCVAAPSFNLASETFIREHVRSIAPGSTVLLCQDHSSADVLGCPVLANVGQWPRWPAATGKLARALRSRWRRYVDPGLARSERQRIKKFFEKHGTEVVLAEFGPTGVLLEQACNEAALPLYVHFHGYDASALLRDPIQVRHYRSLFASAAGIIVPSRALADNLMRAGCPDEKLSICFCGVDVQRFRPGVPMGQRILAVGRLVEKKAPLLTIEAFARIAGKFPDLHLDLVGDGPLAEKCRAVVGERGLETHVTMHGALPSEVILSMMQRAVLFAQHSVVAQDGDTEGVPVSILEAMACGLPVVSTRHSGIPYAVVDGVTGRLVDEHDVNGMASAMAELVGQPEKAATMGRAGHERIIRYFTKEKAARRLQMIVGWPTTTSAVGAC